MIRIARQNTCAGQDIQARIVVAELKKESKEPTTEQQAWLDDFEMIGLCIESLTRTRRGRPSLPRDTIVKVESYCWCPTQWFDGTIEKALA